jgi:hypothetical protein
LKLIGLSSVPQRIGLSTMRRRPVLDPTQP